MRRILAIFRFFRNREQFEYDMDRELRYHVDRQTEQNIAKGMNPEEARRAALLAVGYVEPLKEECRDARMGRLVESMWQDVRYGARVIVKNPGFSFAAIITLALGIGVNTAIFSLVYGVLLRPLPYEHGGQLVVLHQRKALAHVDNLPFAAKDIFDYRDHCRSLDGLVEYHSMNFLLYGNDSAERVQTGVVSANFFDVLGVRPLMGRTFIASDDVHGADAVLVVSYKYWQGALRGDPNIIGKRFQMNDRPHTVVGVLPPIPQYPQENDVYMPTSACPTRSSPRFIANRRARMMTAFGRLKPGVSLKQAQADLSVVASQIQNANPGIYPVKEGYGVVAAPLRDDLTRRARTTFLVLLGCAGFVLLIACANVANLLLARMLKLEREIAVRAALGASRARLARQLLTESVLLAVCGGALGMVLAPVSLSMLVQFAERFTTRAGEVRVDTPVLLFTLLISVATGALFGLAPAFATGSRVGDSIRQGGNRTTASAGRQTLRAALLVSQVAVSFILLIGAALMIRSFLRLQEVNPGFRPDHVLSLRISPDWTMKQIPAHLAELERRVQTIGGVQSVGVTANAPQSPGGVAAGPDSAEFEIEGRPISKGDLAPRVDVTPVSPNYFETIGQPLVSGRIFTEHEDQKQPFVAVINQTLARHRWPTEDPVGKRVSFDHGEHWAMIVGVVGDVKEYGLGRPVADEMYVSTRQGNFANYLLVRTAMDPASITPAVRAVIHGYDSHVAVDRVQTLKQLNEESLASPRVTTILLALFAGLALLISASGIASVMALAVSQRTHELGIRMALGARRESIVGMVVRQGLMLAVLGTAIGMVAAAALSRFLSSLLYDTSPTDVLTYIAVGLLFAAVAMVACFIPARQITSIDPLIALRQE